MTISSEQQELIDLLRSELAEIIHYDTTALAEGASVERMPLLEEFEIHADNIGNAAQLVGLSGLAQCCKHLTKNFIELVSVGTDLSQRLIVLLRMWPNTLLDYLHCFSQPEKETQAVDALLALLAEPDWPISLSRDEQDRFREMFLQSSVEVDEDKHLYPVVVTDEMASMSITDDINPELLKGLLTELPAQVDAFDRAVEQYLITRQSLQLRIAQRVAHTLKGAANVVGIAGMANLMHYLEDILEVVDKHGVVPEGIDDLLQDSADCLSAMSEFLAGIGPRPTDVKSTIEAVLAALRPEESPLKTTSAAVGSFTAAANEELSAEDVVDLEALAFDEALQVLPDQSLDGEELFPEASEVLAIEQQSNVQADEHHPPLAAELEAGAALAEHPDSSDSDSIPTLGDVYHRPGSAFGSGARGGGAPEPAQVVPGIQPQTRRNEGDSAETVTVAANGGATEPAPREDESAPLSVTEAQAQELLRLTGESQIGNTQVLNRLDVVAVGIKSAANYQLQLHQLAQELERVVELQTALASAAGIQQEHQLDPLELERYNELDSFASQLHEVTTDAYEAIADLDEELKLLKGLVQNQRQLGFESQELLLTIRMLPVSVFISRFNRCVRQASRLTGKSAALEITGEEVLVDSRVLSSMIDPIMHLLRNAVDHGLEDSEQERIQRGKDPCGKITLSFRRVADTVCVECTDDGRGLDYDSIAAKAADKGLVPANVRLGVADLNRLILSSGFSTRAEVTQTSGRGVGLDVVNEQIKVLKGTLSIDSRQGMGTRFTLMAPMTVLSAHTLLVSVGKFQVSIMSRALEQIVFVESERLDTSEPQLRYTLTGEEQALPVFALDKLALMDVHSREEDYKALIVTQNQEGERCGVLVESVIASEEQIIKPLNRFTMKIEGVVGAAILGDGRVSPVIDLYELPGLSEAASDSQSWRRRFEQRLAHLQLNQPKERPMALIVDDSLSARRSLAQFIGDMGMEVYTAKDGFEAIQLIEQRIPHIILVDLEMPRMNGLELTQHLRAEVQTRDIPIIMITSRATEKHKSLATRAGVNAYLNKPWTDEELLLSINSQVAS